MRILHITPSFQHPAMRGSTRHYYFIRELSRRHAITLLALTPSPVCDQAMREMVSYTERVLTFSVNDTLVSPVGDLTRRLPLIGKRIVKAWQLGATIQKMKEAFTRLVEQEPYDLVLFHGKPVFSVIRGFHNLPLVVDFCDATSLRFRTEMQYASPARRALLALRYRQVRQVEKEMVKLTPHVAFISNRDREAILGSDCRSEIIPNGVDLDYWQRQSNASQENCLIFTGVMDYMPNEDAALYLIEKILPLVRPSIPNLQVFIAGRNPSSSLLKQASGYRDVVVTGFVDDMRPYLERATLFVAPLRYASGMQNKILEAMAMQVPVIATPIVADGLRIDGKEPPIRIADGERQFAKQIVDLLGQQQERSRLAGEGRQFVAENFIWSHSAERLERMCIAAHRLASSDQSPH